ncbi:MAG TPA: hypothetical protein VIJ92_03920 [Ginsengibacter sp.]
MRHEPRRTHKPRRDASAIGTIDFVTWEFIPLYQPPWGLAQNITLTDKRKKINVVRETRTMADTQTTARCKCQRHDRFCNMGIYSLVSASLGVGWKNNSYG